MSPPTADPFALVLGARRGAPLCTCGPPVRLDEPAVCEASDHGCLAPAGWASDGAGIPSRAVLGRDHDGTRTACLRCGNACCPNCLTDTPCAHHGAPLALCPDCAHDEQYR